MEKVSVSWEDYKSIVHLLCCLNACLSVGDGDFSLLTENFDYVRVHNLLMSV